MLGQGHLRQRMARSTDLPRMQNQAKSRAPIERGLQIVGQAAEPPPKPRSPQMMRQYDLVERVKKYNPKADEDLLNRAYVYAMKARVGRSLLLASARGCRHPDGSQAR